MGINQETNLYSSALTFFKHEKPKQHNTHPPTINSSVIIWQLEWVLWSGKKWVKILFKLKQICNILQFNEAFLMSTMFQITILVKLHRFHVQISTDRFLCHSTMWADHLIWDWFFSRVTLKCSKVATEWDTWQLFASVCAKPGADISLQLLCGSLSVNVYLQCASHLMMDGKVQQHVCIDFCFHLGKTAAETYEMLQAAFRESCLSWSKTFEWYSHFKSGHRSFEDDPAQVGLPPPTPRRPWHVREKLFALTDIWQSERLQRMLE